jgi:serine/threonine-protein kinase
MVLASLGFPFGASWQDDVIVIGQGPGGVVSVPQGGGTPRQLVTLQGDEGNAAGPQLLDDGRTLLFGLEKKSARNWNQGDIVVQPVTGGERRVVVQGGYDGRVLPTGHLVYMRDGTLFGARFDARRAERSGDAVPLIVGVTTTATGAGPGQYSVSRDGRIAYFPAAAQSNLVHRTLVWADRQGREQPIPAEPREYIYPRISPSGKKVALDAQDDHRDIWTWDLEHDILSRLTLEGDTTEKRGPTWAADGRSLFYTSTEGARAVLLRRAADGTGASEKLGEEATAQMLPTSVSPDGKVLVYSAQEPDYNVKAMPLSGDHTPTQLVATPKLETNGEVSPNGKWLAYESDESGRQQIYVRPFPSVDAGRWQVSTGGGSRAVWARNGRELFYVSADDMMMSVPVSGDAGKELTYGRPTQLFSIKPYFGGRESGRPVLIGRTYDVAADGRFFLIKEPAAATGDVQTIAVIEHWIDEVKRRLGQ